MVVWWTSMRTRELALCSRSGWLCPACWSYAGRSSSRPFPTFLHSPPCSCSTWASHRNSLNVWNRLSGARTRKMEGTARRAAQYKIEFTGSLRVTQAPPCPPAWRSLALKPKTMGCLFVLFFFLFFVVKVMKNRVYVECFMDFTQDSVPPLVPALVSN